jgi:hypothetical protein
MQHLRKAKERGFSDYQLAYLLGFDEGTIRNLRKKKSNASLLWPPRTAS